MSNNQEMLNDKILSLKYLIGRDISDSELDEITFIRAVSENNLVKVQKMLDNGASVNTVGGDRERLSDATAIYIACEYGFLDMVKLLVSNGADPTHHCNDGNIGSPLMAAVQYDNVDVARYLLSIGSNVNRSNDLGYTPLQISSSLEMVTLILGRDDLDLDSQLEPAIEEVKQYHSDKTDIIERLESARSK